VRKTVAAFQNEATTRRLANRQQKAEARSAV